MKARIINGDLLDGSKLISEYKTRKNEFDVAYIDKTEPIPSGFKSVLLKNKIKILKPKAVSKNLEDKVWCLFKEIGMNKISSKKFVLELGEDGEDKRTKEIDVVASDGDITFVIECKSQIETGRKDLRAAIGEFHSNQQFIRNNLKNMFKETKFVFLICTENIIWSDNDKIYARQSKIELIDEYDLDKLGELAELAGGEAAKYQIYNLLFQDEKIKDFSVCIPALESQMGGLTYYTFNMVPEHLLKISYVHQRGLGHQYQEMSDTYQRFMKPSRLKQIESFIEDGGFFPGNLILNFNKPVRVDPIVSRDTFDKAIVGKTRPVRLHLPPYFGCAWIIDGQHRLYGYAETKYKHTETLPVVAFVNQPVSKQAKIFVDINKNQKEIKSNLMWDLYEDLYGGSLDDKEKHLAAVSRLVKVLNGTSSKYSSIKGPLNGKIKILDGGKEPVEMSTLCRVVSSLNFIGNDKAPFFINDCEESVPFAAERINEFISIFSKHCSKLWNQGEDGFLCTSAGLSLFLSIFRDLISDMKKEKFINAKSFIEEFEIALYPILEMLNQATRSELDEYISASIGRKQTIILQEKFTNIIVNSFPGIYRSPFLINRRLETDTNKTNKPVLKLLEELESEELEIKSTFELDLNRYVADGELKLKDGMILSVLIRTIAAFLNTKGGNLIIGVAEMDKFKKLENDTNFEPIAYGNYLIIGIDKEFEIMKCDKDKLELKFRDLVTDHLNPAFSNLIKIKFDTLENKTICLINVKPLINMECYVDEKQYYVRSGNRTELLEGSKVTDHINIKARENIQR